MGPGVFRASQFVSEHQSPVAPFSALVAASGYPAWENRGGGEGGKGVKGTGSMVAAASTTFDLSSRLLCFEWL